MFMKFAMCDHQGNPTGGRMIINLKTIDQISEMGNWVQHNDLQELPVAEFLNNATAVYAHPARAAHIADNFVTLVNCVSINTMNNNWTVVANFDELAATLESLNDIFERI